MRIGLIGWYGHSNAGDERTLYCLQSFFSEHELLVIGSYGEALTRVDELNKCDYVLLGGGGLILRGMGKFAPLMDRIKPPFGCVGISVEAVHPDNLDLINALMGKAGFIYVRDAQSKKYLGNSPKVIVGPDLTFLFPFEALEVSQTDTCGLNLRDWYYWQGDYGGAYSRIMHRLNRRFPSMYKFYPLPKWRSEKAVSILRQAFTTVRPIPLYTESTKRNDIRVLAPFFDSVPDSFSPDLYRDCRYFVGMRLHSVIFACQMGIPFISLSYQPKNVQFCNTLGLSDYSVKLTRLSRLNERIAQLRASYQSLREHLLSFTEEKRKEANRIMLSILHEMKRV